MRCQEQHGKETNETSGYACIMSMQHISEALEQLDGV